MVVLNEVAAILPDDEEVRWDALSSYNILDTVSGVGGGLVLGPGCDGRRARQSIVSASAMMRCNFGVPANAAHRAERPDMTAVRQQHPTAAARGEIWAAAGRKACGASFRLAPHPLWSELDLSQQEPEEAYERITKLCKSLFKVRVCVRLCVCVCVCVCVHCWSCSRTSASTLQPAQQSSPN